MSIIRKSLTYLSLLTLTLSPLSGKEDDRDKILNKRDPKCGVRKHLQ